MRSPRQAGAGVRAEGARRPVWPGAGTVGSGPWSDEALEGGGGQARVQRAAGCCNRQLCELTWLRLPAGACGTGRPVREQAGGAGGPVAVPSCPSICRGSCLLGPWAQEGGAQSPRSLSPPGRPSGCLLSSRTTFKEFAEKYVGSEVSTRPKAEGPGAFFQPVHPYSQEGTRKTDSGSEDEMRV